MSKADYIGTISIDFIDRSQTNWLAMPMDDIIQQGLITKAPDYLFTAGSGVASWMTSCATTPAYPLPTHSQFYLAGRDVFRWGGLKDPYEIDVDHYGFTPDYEREAVICWKAPKSEPHHLSQMPQLLEIMPDGWKEICSAVIERKLT